MITSLISKEEIDNAVRKFRRGLEWNWSSTKGFSKALDASLHAAPLPRPPPIDSDPCAAYAIKQYPDVFKIVCPIDVPLLAHLLRDHPNRAFVESVLHGLTHGFWPFADLPSPDITHHPNHRVCGDHPIALAKSRDEELEGGRYSPPFYHLLQGMKVSPLLAVEKPGSSKLRICTDMSFGAPSLNDLIDKDKARVAYDSLISFAPYMTEIETQDGALVLWKSVPEPSDGTPLAGTPDSPD